MRAEAERVKSDLIATLGWTDDDAEAFVRSSSRAYGGHLLADAVQTLIHDEHIHTTWPPCHLHPNHPYVLRLVGEVEFWACPRDGSLQCPVGKLGELRQP